MNAAMAAVETGHSVVDIAATYETNGESTEIIAEAEGDFQAPDRMRFTGTFTYGDFTIEEEVMHVSGVTYRMDPSSGAWEIDNAPSEPFGSIFTLGMVPIVFSPEVVEGLTLTGSEDLNGEPVYHLSGGVLAAAVEEMIDDDAEFDEGGVEYWVGSQDFLIRMASVKVVQSSSDGADVLKIRVSVALSDYGKEVDIQAPEAATDESDSEGEPALITTELESGWSKTALPEKGFAISAPPSWLILRGGESFNLRSRNWLVGSGDECATGEVGYAGLVLQIDSAYSAYGGLSEYVEYIVGNLAFIAGIEKENVETTQLELSAGNAHRLEYSNVSQTYGVDLFHAVYVIPGDEAAYTVTLTSSASCLDEMAPVFDEMARTVDLFEPTVSE